jgi:hypothetical protein
MTYSSIVPSEMSNFELQTICTELQTAINWKLPTATIKLKNGLSYKLETSRLRDYQSAFKTETGQIKL